MEISPASARMFAGILEQRTGQLLPPAEQGRLEVALDTLVRAHGFGSADAVAAAVAGGRDPALSDAVIEALLNGETSFFRDPDCFGQLSDNVVPRVMAARPDRALRIWSAGCSTGQEAYSVAIALAENAGLDGWQVDIVATDVSRGAIEQARAGRYSEFEVGRGLSPQRATAWFVRDGDRWRVRAALRDSVRFHTLSLLDTAPLPGTFDIILCRNVLSRFAGDVRRRAVQRLARAIAPDGFVMLGAGETLAGSAAFVADDGFQRPVPASQG
ncbi:CheR family methyltransferase [Sphingomonas arantia]|uniref:CheR family methyltransferase n=1 Tax=Sphingomonas arantia TaxID=1460676 RepID=A0ABW4TZE0_9SPHN